MNNNSMGGHALKTITTVRKNKVEYLEIKSTIADVLSKNNIIFDFIPELDDKKSFGDLDILWNQKTNPTIVMRDTIEQLFSPCEVVTNGDVISFDYNDFQIDFIKCQSVDFAKCYFSYGDFGQLLGVVINKYDLTFGHNGFFCHINQTSLLLTQDVNQFFDFININFDQWKNIRTQYDLFELIKTCKFYDPDLFIQSNHKHRLLLKNRPLYSEFLKYINLDTKTESISISSEDKEMVFNQVIVVFNKIDDIIKIQELDKKKEIIHSKFNGNMLKDMGYDGKQIGTIIKKFKSLYDNFDEWIYQTKSEDIMAVLKVILLEI